MGEENTRLTWGRIFVFWAPLSATWLMMASEGPFLSALIARMTDPVHNLASYGITLAIALLIEAPVVMIMSAATALAGDADSWRRISRYTIGINAVVTAALATILIPPVFDLLIFGVMDAPEEVGRLSRVGIAIMLPWPAAIGFRRLYNGLMIRFDRTRLVAYGTVVRLVSMAAIGSGLYLSDAVPGAWVGAAGLSGGVCVEAIAARLMVGSLLRRIRSSPRPPDVEPLTYRYINRFYMPLALTTVMNLGTYTVVTFFMGQSRMALESLAVMPVVNALLFLFTSFGLSYQEVGIALMVRGAAVYRPLRNFAISLGVLTSLGLAVLGFTPAAALWFHHVSGLSLELTEFARLPVMILSPMPGLMVLMSFQRSILVFARRTGPIIWATVLELAVIVLVLWFGVRGGMIGAVVAGLALLLGRFSSCAYQSPYHYYCLKNIWSREAG